MIGVTGGFGMGKTTVAKWFQKWGAHRIDADRLAHGALEKTSPVYPRLSGFLKEALDRRGRFRKDRLAAIIFKDQSKRKRLEAVVHPYVFRRMIETARKSKKKIVAAEVPLLFESGFDRRCDFTVAVYASPGVVRKRLRARGFSAAEISARAAAQMPIALKIRKADAVINNSGEPEKTKRQTRMLWEELCAASKRRK